VSPVATTQGGPESEGKDDIFQKLESILERERQLQVTRQKTKESSRDLSTIDHVMLDVLGQCSQLLQQEEQVRSVLNSNFMM